MSSGLIRFAVASFIAVAAMAASLRSLRRGRPGDAPRGSGSRRSLARASRA